MMTFKLFVFRRLLLIVLSINRTVLCLIQMSSSDDEVQSPNLGVSRFRAVLTIEQLDQHKIDGSYGSLVRYSDSKLFANLLEEHNDEKSDFHFDLFEPFIIGRELNAKDVIVYLKFSSIWHLLNFFRNIAAGLLLQLNGDAT